MNFMKIAKAIVAGLVPLALPFLHQLGLVNATPETLTTALMTIISFIAVYLVPNKTE